MSPGPQLVYDAQSQPEFPGAKRSEIATLIVRNQRLRILKPSGCSIVGMMPTVRSGSLPPSAIGRHGYGRSCNSSPAIGELGENALSRPRELIAAQRLAVGQSAGDQQRLGESVLVDLGVEHSHAVTEPPPISAFLQRG